MDAVAVDLLLVNSKHNVQYLLGGYRFFFYEHMAAMGLVRSPPLLALPAGRFEDAFCYGSHIESWQIIVESIWGDTVNIDCLSAVDIARDAARRLAKLLPKDATITIEEPFMPADVMAILKKELLGVH